MNEVVRYSDVFYKSLSKAASIKAEVEVSKCGAHENVLKMEMGYVHKIDTYGFRIRSLIEYGVNQC